MTTPNWPRRCASGASVRRPRTPGCSPGRDGNARAASRGDGAPRGRPVDYVVRWSRRAARTRRSPCSGTCSGAAADGPGDGRLFDLAAVQRPGAGQVVDTAGPACCAARPHGRPARHVVDAAARCWPGTVWSRPSTAISRDPPRPARHAWMRSARGRRWSPARGTRTGRASASTGTRWRRPGRHSGATPATRSCAGSSTCSSGRAPGLPTVGAAPGRGPPLDRKSSRPRRRPDHPRRDSLDVPGDDQRLVVDPAAPGTVTPNARPPRVVGLQTV